MHGGHLFRSLALVVALGTGLATAAGAAEKDSNLSQEAKGDRGVLSDSALAHELYDYGKKSKDALAVIAAAKIAAGVATQEGKSEKAEEGEGKAPAQGQAGTDSASAPPSVDTMVATARQLAGDDKALQAMIDDVAATRGKGLVGGALVRYDTVRGGYTDAYRGMSFRGNSTAEVAVVGDGDTDLDLFIYDENGNLICQDLNYSDRSYCRWVPRWTGPFTIKIRNNGGVSNSYVMMTN
jgi:hypothetical protein